MKMFSVILLIYNSTMEKVLRTLDSILRQNLDIKEMEIIIADDGSKRNLNNEIATYLKGKDITYKFTAHLENLGTVKNIIEGLSICEGKYVKLIGAGDALFDKSVLKEVYTYMEQKNAECCFGLMQSFYYDKSGKIVQRPFRAPKDISVYRKRKVPWTQIENNILIFGDWISGASMFYRKETLEFYLARAKETVKYCEDLITANLVLDRKEITFIERPVVWYELGDGITTVEKRENPFLKKIYRDHDKYFEYLRQQYPDSKKLKKNKKYVKYNRSHDWKCKILKLFLTPERLEYILRVQGQKEKDLYKYQMVGFLDEKE